MIERQNKTPYNSIYPKSAALVIRIVWTSFLGNLHQMTCLSLRFPAEKAISFCKSTLRIMYIIYGGKTKNIYNTRYVLYVFLL